jgi:23S rRNA (cytosine1962-C5)-methyltransferase
VPDLAALVQRAAERRGPLAERADTTAYRLAHGAADGLPGVAVDRFDDVLVVHLHDPRLPAESYVRALVDRVAPVRAAYVKRHPRQSSRLRESEREALAPPLPAWGEPVEALEVLENGVRYQVRPGDRLSVGLFLDMREARQWVREQAKSRTVLNLFAYTCAFGVCASLGGATRVLNLDASRPYLRWGQDNYALNNLAPDLRDFVYGDAFDWLRRFGRRGERFDLVILDPPSFSTTRESRFAAERDYGRLVAAAAPVVTPRGILVAATNHAGISPAQFTELVAQGLADAHRKGRVVARWHEPEIDFPISPNTRPYLKIQAVAMDEPRSS